MNDWNELVEKYFNKNFNKPFYPCEIWLFPLKEKMREYFRINKSLLTFGYARFLFLPNYLVFENLVLKIGYFLWENGNQKNKTVLRLEDAVKLIFDTNNGFPIIRAILQKKQITKKTLLFCIKIRNFLTHTVAENVANHKFIYDENLVDWLPKSKNEKEEWVKKLEKSPLKRRRKAMLKMFNEKIPLPFAKFNECETSNIQNLLMESKISEVNGVLLLALQNRYVKNLCNVKEPKVQL